MLLFATGWAQQSNKPNNSTIPVVTDVFVPQGHTGLTNYSYVRSWTAQAPLNNVGDLTGGTWKEASQLTTYIDGLGRPIQTVARQVSPGSNPKDLVSPQSYDVFGRQTHQFLPYISNSSNGLFRNDPFLEQKAYLEGKHANPGEKVFYSQTQYENSPLNRQVKVMSPGNSWGGSGRGNSNLFMTNTSTDEVVNWDIGSVPLTYANNDVATNIPAPSATIPYYTEGMLSKLVTINESGNAQVEYKDKDGKVILSKVQAGAISSDYSGYAGFLCTYHIYDQVGNLRFVISPKAVEAIRGTWNLNNYPTVINELCYRYEYDGQDRMVAKKVPGAGWTYMVYDADDRLVFSQDANLRAKNQWLTMLYDVHNRQVITGIIGYTGSATSLQSEVSAITGNVVIPPGTLADLPLSTPTAGDYVATNSISLNAGFITTGDFSAKILSANGGNDIVLEGQTVNKYPVPSGATFIPLVINYYDNYSWVAGKPFVTTYHDKLTDIGRDLSKNTNLYPEDIPLQASNKTKGMVTGTKTRIMLDPNNLTLGTWITSVNYYDDKGRVIQEQSDNHKQGQDIVTNRYDFTGKLIGSYQVHTTSNGTPGMVKIRTINKFDPGGRLLETNKMLNDDPTKSTTIVSNEYDELSQLVATKLGQKRDASTNLYTTDPIETLNYTYNLQGWIRGINKDFANGVTAPTSNWFGMEFNYDWGFENQLYNGMISGVKWRSRGDGERRSYGFTYDKLNRLLGADFAQFSGATFADNGAIKFDVQLGDGLNGSSAYDENGNTRSMQQWGLKVNSSAKIDDLIYSYFDYSNKLKNVAETGTGATDHKLGDFTDRYTTAQGANDYGYDKSGNLITDMNKKMNGVTGIDQEASGGAVIYNHLNLPWKITLKNDAGTEKGNITYIYDASGVKLQKITEDISVAGKRVVTTTDYLAGMVYESKTTTGGTPPPGPADNYDSKLQLILSEAGRIRYLPAEGSTPANFVFDYFIRDNLGNVRMVLTDEVRKNQYLASMELVSRTQEEQLFANIGTTAVSKASIPNFPVDGSPLTTPNDYVAKTNGSGNKTGPAIVLKVMSGDQIEIGVRSFYKDQSSPGNNSSFADVLSALATGIVNTSGVGKGTLTELTANGGPAYLALQSFVQNNNGDISGKPKAYLNWVFLDEQLNFIQSESGAIPVGNYPANQINTMPKALSTINKNGYLYIYVNNESQGWDVFFDNLMVNHHTGPIVEENHFYPFGLLMTGISSKAMGKLANKYKYNGGNELQSMEFGDGSGLDWYDAVNRMYDAQIGRFGQIDELTDGYWEWSPYSFGFNSPLNFNDPLGLEADPGKKRRYSRTSNGSHAEVLDAVVVRGRYSTEYMVRKYWHFRNKYDRDGKSDAFIKEAPKEFRNWMYRYHDTQLFIEKVHELNRERDILALDIASNFLPMGWIGKLRYLKYAKYLKVARKGGGLAVRFVEKASGEYMRNVAKKLIANGGKLSQVDAHDVLVSTVINTLTKNIAVRWGGEVLNGLTDYTQAGGLKSAFATGEYQKDPAKTAQDLVFGHLKFALKNYAETAYNWNSTGRDLIDVTVDQAKNKILKLGE